LWPDEKNPLPRSAISDDGLDQNTSALVWYWEPQAAITEYLWETNDEPKSGGGGLGVFDDWSFSMNLHSGD
jgi:hypothetical protein